MRQSVTLVLITLLLSTKLVSNSWAGVGKVTEQTGPTEIVREKKSIPSSLNAAVEMNDTISTAKSKAQVTFEDNTTVKLTEHSKVVIDDFVYDPKKGTGKLAINMAMGTARYASGQIAKNNPQQVAIKTPTANIAVRGTDFTTTVDELGRSLIILLPSCDKTGCVTGAIEVSNAAGVVLLDVPYQATMVTSSTVPPTSPTVVKLDQANINNMLIISKPPEIPAEQRAEVNKDKSALDFNELNVDLLKYSALEENKLDNNQSIDRNELNNDLLSVYTYSELDAQNKTLLENSLDNSLLPGYSEATGLKYYFNEDKSRITLYRVTNNTASVTLDTTRDLTLNLSQDGTIVKQQVNKGSTTVINITQQ